MALKTRIQQVKQQENPILNTIGNVETGAVDDLANGLNNGLNYIRSRVGGTPVKSDITGPSDIQMLQDAIAHFVQPKIISPLAQGAQSIAPKQAVQQVLAAKSIDTPTPTPTPPDNLTQNIQKGFVKYGMDPNTAMQNASYFAQAGQGLPDPYLPATIALKESSGGKTSQGQNNWINIMSPGTNVPVDYPDMKTALVGGNGHLGFRGILQSGIYNDYLKSGDLHDFFSHYTPSSDPRNADYSSQIQTYNQLRSNFTGS